MTVLQRLAHTHLMERIRRGDLGPDSARNSRIALRGLCVTFGDRPVNQLGEAAIERWLETTQHLAAATRRNYLGAVKRFCGWLVKKKHIRVNPCDDIQRIRQPRKVVHTVTRDEMDLLWQACDTPRDRALIGLMFVLGLRCIDVANINVEDIDWSGKTIIVTGKGGHERTVPLVDKVARLLRAHISTAPRTTGPLFPSSHGRLRPGTISGRVSELMYRAGVKHGPFDGKSAHALRRTAATETLESSHDLRAVQDLLGHADLSSLKHYLQRADVSKVAAAVDSRFDAA